MEFCRRAHRGRSRVPLRFAQGSSLRWCKRGASATLSFAPLWLESISRSNTHGLRCGLHYFAATRLILGRPCCLGLKGESRFLRILAAGRMARNDKVVRVRMGWLQLVQTAGPSTPEFDSLANRILPLRMTRWLVT